MSAGYMTTKSSIDTKAGELAVGIRDMLDAIQNFKAFLDSQTDPMLELFGYDATDIARLRSAFVDLDKLARIYLGTQDQAAPYDFRTFSKFLTGVN